MLFVPCLIDVFRKRELHLCVSNCFLRLFTVGNSIFFQQKIVLLGKKKS